MMASRFENLWKSAAGDGALSPVGVARPDCDYDDLMDAWLRERQESIESKLYLDEARRLLRKMIVVEQVPPGLRKRARHLLEAIQAGRAAGG
jgi:hypothetical protein